MPTLAALARPHRIFTKIDFIKPLLFGLCTIICLTLFVGFFLTDSRSAQKNMKKLTFVSDNTWQAYAENPLESEQAIGYAQLVKLRNDSPPWASSNALVYGHWAGGWSADLATIPGANWVWAPGVTGQTPISTLHTVYFTKRFDLQEPVVAAELYISADDFAQVLVNNRAVGTIGSITDATKATKAQSALTRYDISQYLVKGVNTITIRAQNGFVSQWGGNYAHNPAGVVFGGSFTFAKNLTATDNQETYSDTRTSSTFKRGLVAYYPFNNTAKDMSGNDNNGLVYGAIPSKDRHGKDNGAYYFNGQDSYIIVPNPINLNSMNGAITLAAWIKIDPKINSNGYIHHHIISKGATYAHLWADFALGLSKALQIDFEETNQANRPERFNSEQNLLIGNWYHLAATFEENTSKLYLNGKLIKIDQSPHSVFRNSNQPLYIGCRYVNPLVGVFKGSIDDVRIYNYVLSDKEVFKLYNDEE